MNTKMLRTTETERTKSITTAATYLKRGEVVAIPTETVYGLAADATNEQAVRKIFAAKGRPQDNPLIIHVASKEQLMRYVTHVRPYVEALIDTFSPGPITYVLPSSNHVAPNVTAGLPTVGIRIPRHEITLSLLEKVQVPLAAPSANLSGRPSPTSAQHVMDDLNGKIAAILDGGHTDIGIESTVIDCTEDVPIVLRLGAITERDIVRVVGNVHIATNSKVGESPRSPGQKYVHYAPDVPLLLVTNRNKLQRTIDEERLAGRRVAVMLTNDTTTVTNANKIALLGTKSTAQMQKLYDLLRSYNEREIDVIVCEAPDESVETAALLDRLTRAATKVIE
ncbi:MAG TPA: L-threonylcarbamoyladenylate synthase [Pseudogracilibacillus sp.]|nr:L-threonylcarbamoyladenylate synthase [Pseudogracilibacillus sp.]